MMPEKKTFLLSTAYFGPIQYFSKIYNGHVIFEKHENYSKQTYRNRCVIYGANGPLILNIPVKRKKGSKTQITEIEIDYSTNWTQLHKRGIMSAYSSAPFYEYYIDEILPFFEKKHKYLFDFNLKTIEVICDFIQCKFIPEFTTSFIHSPETYYDYREKIHPKKRMQHPDLMYEEITYNQVFIEKKGYIPNLSILDMLFNEGPNTNMLLKDSYKTL